jgi:hypothetical protein
MSKVLFGSKLFGPRRNAKNFDVGGGKEKEIYYYYYSEWKYWPSSPLLCLRNLYVYFN